MPVSNVSSANVRFIAVEERSRQRRLNVLDDLGVELIFRLELGCGLARCNQQCPSRLRRCPQLTYFLHLPHPHSQPLSLPIELYYHDLRRPLALWNTGFDALDLLWSEARDGSLVLGSRYPRGPNGSLEIGDGS